jgi:LuxR family maltose regulon positive regulatory protein
MPETPAPDVPANAQFSDVLLATKLYIPSARPAQSVVPRPRLLDRLDRGLASRLTLISAPPGFGKTTLLSEWLTTCRVPAAWLSLDAADNDLMRFQRYLAAALQTVAPQIGQTIQELLRAPQPPPIKSILTVLVNEICSLPDHLILILDDYHTIEAAAVHNAIAFLLDNLPPCLHLVMATRADPPLPLARWRSRGQLVEVRTDDLRFTPAESAAFLNQVMGLSLSAEDIAALESRTEGWIVGLQMAAISMQGKVDATAFIRAFSGSHHYVLDYLVEEVLSRQPEDIQTFLLRTSVLERLAGSLCDAVMGQTGSQAVLEGLERANLFLASLDDERRWYRYHHLFGEMLRARLQRAYPPEEIRALHHSASQWYEQHGRIDKAVQHALLVEDFDRVAALIERSAGSLLQRGELTTLLRWLGALPDMLVRTSPRLSLIYAWTLLASSQFEAMEPRLQDAERALGLTADQVSSASTLSADLRGALGEVLCIRANLAFHRADLPRMLALSQQATDCLSDGVEAGLFHTRPTLRGVVALNTALAHEFSGDARQASEMFDETIALSRPIHNAHLVMLSFSHLAHIQCVRGRLHQAAETCRQAIQYAQDNASPPSPLLGMVYVGLGDVLCEWNELEHAQSHLQQGIDLARLWSNWETLVPGHLGLARLQAARGDWAGAAQALADLANRVPPLQSPWGIPLIHAHQAWLEVRQGDLDAAAAWVQQTDLAVEGDLAYPREPEAIILARVLTALGQLDEAARLFERLLAAAEAGGRTGHFIEALISQSLALQAQGKPDAALMALKRALTLAEPEGYIRVFADEGAAMAGLLARVVPSSVYVARLLAAFQGPEAESAGGAGAVAHPSALLEPLSQRELEILRLLAEGLSNRQIAARLVLAVGTVKAHVHTIYGKLGVQGRVQAIARARELGLL